MGVEARVVLEDRSAPSEPPAGAWTDSALPAQLLVPRTARAAGPVEHLAVAGSVTQRNRVQEAVSDNSKLCDSGTFRRDRRFLSPSTRPNAPGNRVPWSPRRVRLIAPRADGLPRGRSTPWDSAGPTRTGQDIGRRSRGPAM